MDYAQKINEMRAQRATLKAEAEQHISANRFEEAKGVQAKIEKLNADLELVEALAKDSQNHAEPPKPQNEKPFRTFGEQMKAVMNAARGTVDERLLRVNDLSGTTGADGGFAVQQDFMVGIMESVVSRSPLLSRLDRYTVGANSNGAQMLCTNETDVSSSLYGGVSGYWVAEAGDIPASNPSFRQVDLKLEKLAGLCYVTEEMMEDATFLGGWLQTAFQNVLDRKLVDAVINGNGTGKPTGLLNSGALAVAAKETSQAAGTIVAKNVIKMKNQFLGSPSRAIWLAHPDAEEQLQQMTIADKAVWLPDGGLSGSEYQTLFGKDIIYEDACAALGSKGDIMLIDPFMYMMIAKGSVRQDWSAHVAFVSDKRAFRIVMRCNGAPKVSSPITIAHSTAKRSPFVALAERA